MSLGARCDLAESSGASPGGVSFTVSEFAVLDDGRRITLHADRGWTSWARSTGAAEPIDPWTFLTREHLEQDVLNVVLPDDAETTGQSHEWAWLCELLQRHGIEATVDELKAIPYAVEISDDILSRLRTEDCR